MKKRIFISFDYDEDRHYKNLLLAWDKHDDFDFEFYDGSLRVAINSTDAAYVKSKIKPHIQAAGYLLCLVGKNSAKSDWIAWEIETALGFGKTLIGVKIDRSYDSPKGLLGVGTTWAHSFTFDSIKKAIDEA